MLARVWVAVFCMCEAGWAQREPRGETIRYATRGLRGAVAAGSEAAAEAGMQMYRRGGNAVDAGVAAMFAAAVVEYSHFGLGGEAPILIRSHEGKVVSLAGVGPMPQLATAEMFRARPLQFGEMLSPPDRNGLKGFVPVAGLMPALVPGMVEAALVALKNYGVRSAAEVMQPAIELADGAAMDETRSNSIARGRKFFELWPSSKRVFLPNGRVPRPGDIFRQPDLARTMRAMVEAERRALAGGAGRAAAVDAVRDCFYRGEVARKIDAFSRENDGLLRYSDLAAFRIEPEEAASLSFRGYRVHKPGFWSQGPSMLQALNLLDGFDLAGMRLNTADYVHTVVEALKLAYADRDTYYGDPAFAEVPGERLLSPKYAAERRALIGPSASGEFRPGRIGPNPPPHPSQVDTVSVRIDDTLMARDTTCITAVDQFGNVFSATPSGAWLPSVIAGDTGIPLTQRAQSFLLISGHPNELAGGKRPRITLSPTLVTRDGNAYMALATPGGDNQDQSLLQVMLNTVVFGMDAQQAIEAPRFQTRHLVSSFDNHAMNPADLLLDERIPQPVGAELRARLHKVRVRSRWSSGAAPVMIRLTPQGVIEAGADPYGHRTARAW